MHKYSHAFIWLLIWWKTVIWWWWWWRQQHTLLISHLLLHDTCSTLAIYKRKLAMLKIYVTHAMPRQSNYRLQHSCRETNTQNILIVKKERERELVVSRVSTLHETKYAASSKQLNNRWDTRTNSIRARKTENLACQCRDICWDDCCDMTHSHTIYRNNIYLYIYK